MVRDVRKHGRWILRYALPAVAVAAAVAGAIALSTSGGEGSAPQLSAQAGAAGTDERFAVLSRASSNHCGLQSSHLSKVARDGRLQGSCCFPMDLHRYREQVSGLRSYASVPEVPRDPYDVPVALAKRLIAYDEEIELSAGEQAIYDRAMKVSEEGGPCCCRCWRWTAFGGQAKFLIARRDYGVEQIAEIWELEDGCGGAGHRGHES